MVSLETGNTQTKIEAFSMKNEFDNNGDRNQQPSSDMADGFTVGQTQNTAMLVTVHYSCKNCGAIR